MSKIYLIGSLRDKRIPKIANEIREKTGHEVFDDWFAPGPRADDHWRGYETARGRSYGEALKGLAATHIFSFDKTHLDNAEIGVLILPSGRSCHLELGYMLGQGKLGYVLMDNPERWDVMYQFATGIAFNMDELMEMINACVDCHNVNDQTKMPWNM